MDLSVVVIDYASRLQDIRTVRDAVFLQEQQISREDEVDDRDEICRHVLVYAGDHAVATGRLDVEKDGKVGRVAVLASHRLRGIGRLAMQEIEAEAVRQGLNKIWFHAQKSAIEFYLTQDYHITSEEFLEAGIVHVKMEKEVSRALDETDSAQL